MYRPNDVLMNGQRIPNIFNTQDEEFHTRYTRPIGGFWTLGRMLEQEPFMDETLKKFTDTLTTRFIDGSNAGKTCMMDEWLAYCKLPDWFGRARMLANIVTQMRGILPQISASRKITAFLMRAKTLAILSPSPRLASSISRL